MEKIPKTSIKKIVLIGAESTGKTELSESLSKHYNTVSVPEYVRGYIENLERAYTYEDVENIARKQVELENKYYQKANNFLFFDTYLIITKIWFKLVYHKIPDWLDQRIMDNKIDLFLLCKNDIPWIPDSVRENGGEMREKLFEIYKEELTKNKFNYKIISGKGEKRFKNAIKFVDEFFDKK